LLDRLELFCSFGVKNIHAVCIFWPLRQPDQGSAVVCGKVAHFSMKNFDVEVGIQRHGWLGWTTERTVYPRIPTPSCMATFNCIAFLDNYYLQQRRSYRLKLHFRIDFAAGLPSPNLGHCIGLRYCEDTIYTSSFDIPTRSRFFQLNPCVEGWCGSDVE